MDGATITDPNGRVSVITGVDVEAQNGVVHVINKVILPNLTTSVENLRTMDIEIYPNPASEVLNIRSTEPFSEIRIMNLTGKMVMQRNINSTNERIDISGFVPGIYFVNVRNEQEDSTSKIIVR
jgi:hypothetical protein